MCGLAGVIRFGGAEAYASILEKAADSLAPRGPDGMGLYACANIALAHRRLKIIDLSEHAAQPMVDSELGLALVFNGAIYNYKELRSELEAKGYRFFSDGDTEVILKAFHCWGTDCVKRFNGMFAFAIWERDTGRVTLARDRLGIKPLYYAQVGKTFRFASTLPALLAMGDIDTTLNPIALNYYLHFHAVVPAPHTILNGVSKLPPATVMVVEPDGSVAQRSYWQLDFVRSAEEESRSEAEWKSVLREKLTAAARRRLVADVPVGVLLSGGLDSSLIVALLDELGQKDIHTFSVGFADTAEEEGNEFRYSDLIAQHFATRHHKIFADEEMLLQHLPDCIKAMSEPMVSHDAIGFYLLSREVSKYVKVVQSGQGADEVFAGYHWYPPLKETSPEPAEKRYADLFFDRAPAEYAQMMNPDFLREGEAIQFVRKHFSLPGAPEAVEKALRLDTTIMLVDDPVKRVDNMTMAWGLEARVPFLDHELVELAARIPSRHKLAQGGKHILKQLGRDMLPHEVIDRPKGYFPVPALKYLDGPYLERVRDLLHSSRARQRNIFQKDYVEKLLALPHEHLTPLRGSKLWQLGLLEWWLEEQGL